MRHYFTQKHALNPFLNKIQPNTAPQPLKTLKTPKMKQIRKNGKPTSLIKPNQLNETIKLLCS